MNLTTINYITWVWTAVAAFTFVFLFFVTAPYGRHIRKGWGLELNNRLGWVLMESPSFLIIAYFMLIGQPSSYALMLGVLWMLHYINRSFIFPFRIRTTGKKTPLSIVLSAIFFNGINAGLNGYYLSFLENYSVNDFYNWKFILGIILFVTGVIVNHTSDNILINLRKPGETGYKIPEGALYRWISCPNFFGEIIEWSGFALMAWNWPALSFLLWTVANVLPRAVKHHQWYQDKFQDYPKERKAIIPFVV